MPTANTTTPKAKAAKPRAKAAAKPAARKTTRATSSTTKAPANYAERAVLIPVGAALIARDRVVETVSDTVSNYSSTTKAQEQLRRFEHRGVTARNRLEREVRKARVRVERELRQRRQAVESTVTDLEARRDAIAKNGTELANKVPEFASRVPNEIATRVPELANKVQERVLSLV
jgi:seryl-tRNA synthetase